ncbi:MAG TPA: tetratricopeptide repeat protein [Pyrinomonadaceae bacterium]|nr:tetratricopeptide repeat protein [Pyrinomonadaceae bacterium]
MKVKFTPTLLFALVWLLVLTSGANTRLAHAQIRHDAGGGILLDLKNPPAYSSERPDDKVEDALALGNSARSTKPPRYADAERAYRLAAKLGPRDPRPYIGLANVYSDQRRFKEATAAYMKALELVKVRQARGFMARRPARRPAASETAPPPRSVVTQPSPAPRVNYGGERNGEWLAYLGAALLQQGEFGRAGFEFKKAILQDPENAQWHALRGHSLLAQKRYAEAIASFEDALKLEPGYAGYKELLDQTSSEQTKALRQDSALVQTLEDKSWEITSERHGRTVCMLTAEGKMTCTSGNTPERAGLWKVEGGLLHTYTVEGDTHCAGGISDGRGTLFCDESLMPSTQHPDGRYSKWKETWRGKR